MSSIMVSKISFIFAAIGSLLDSDLASSLWNYKAKIKNDDYKLCIAQIVKYWLYISEMVGNIGVKGRISKIII